MNLNKAFFWCSVAAAILAPAAAWAVDEPALDSGDTAWMLTSTALVLFMTIPGLALFYSGMVRSKNVLSVMMQCVAITSLITLLWVVFGYSAAFGEQNPYWGGFTKALLAGVSPESLWGTIPEPLFMTFQMTFAIITPALIVGAFAERMKFSALLLFMAIWFGVVYVPVCHWVWASNGWLFNKGIIDFAGGTVVHINAGIAGLVAALVVGKRRGYPTTPMAPHNVGYTVIGAAMLWVGWFGFNAGSALMANGTAGMAMAVTQIAAACAALGWMFCEWKLHGKPSVLGIASGAVAGLVAITPASGTAGPLGAIAIGFIAGGCCFISAVKLKRKLGYDDSLDVFGVHAVGGIIGALLSGVFCAESLGGTGFLVGAGTMGGQLAAQALGGGSTLVYSGAVSFVILKALDAVIGLRVNESDETEGLDIALHDERGYNL
ncbi:MAG: ammonium transporter [Gammaproteobacteria bacterium]|nr:ammonium transporter [Gammaproteobacteria bacterium]